MRSHPVLSFLPIVCLLAFMHSVQADDEMDSTETARLQQSGEILQQEQILERARARQPGEVTEIEVKKKRGQYIYEVDIADDKGVKRELKFDAKTGEFLAIEEDDDDGDNDNSGSDDDHEPEEKN